MGRDGAWRTGTRANVEKAAVVRKEESFAALA